MGLFSSVGKVLGSVAGPLVSGALGIGSTILGNNSAKHEAERNRDYQTQMSNTSIQRRMADLKAAGLNPLLAVESASSGASTPSGTQADIKHFDPNSILALSNARLVNAQAQAQENDNNLYEYKKESAKWQADLIRKYNLTEEKKQILLDTENLEKAANILKTYAETAGQNLSNKQAEEIIFKLRMENEILANGYTPEMLDMYPGMWLDKYAANNSSVSQSIAFNTGLGLHTASVLGKKSRKKDYGILEGNFTRSPWYRRGYRGGGSAF